MLHGLRMPLDVDDKVVIAQFASRPHQSLSELVIPSPAVVASHDS